MDRGAPPPGDWMHRARSKDPETLADLYAYLRDGVLGLLGNCSGCGVDPEDILMQPVLLVFENLGSLRNDDSLLAYGIKVARRLRDRARQQASRAESLSSSLAKSSMLEGSDESLSNLLREEWLQALVRKLGIEQRLLFTMLFVEGKNDEEVQTTLDLSREALRGRKHRLFDNLRRLSRADEEDKAG